jgi:hypothetical protein
MFVAVSGWQIPMAATLERRDVAVGGHCIADRNPVGELVTPEYDGLPIHHD